MDVLVCIALCNTLYCMCAFSKKYAQKSLEVNEYKETLSGKILWTLRCQGYTSDPQARLRGPIDYFSRLTNDHLIP